MELAKLIEHGILTNYPSCPVCSSVNRELVKINYVHTKYLAALDSVLPFPLKYPIKKCDVYKCLNCATKYADPWLSTKYSSMLYSSGLSQHKSGWLALHKKFNVNYSLINPSRVEINHKKLSEIYLHALKYIGSCNSYMQVNCPFSGELLAFREIESPNTNFKKEFSLLRRALNKNNVYPKSLYKFIRKKLKKYSRVVQQSDSFTSKKLIPSERILLYEQSSLCWGSNCNLQGVSCSTFCSTVLKAPIQSYSDLKYRTKKIDICRFDNLDHFFNPMEILDRILGIAKICIIHIHVENLKMQHHFVFDRNFSDYLRRCGYSVKDMTELLSDKERINYSQFIVSKCLNLE